MSRLYYFGVLFLVFLPYTEIFAQTFTTDIINPVVNCEESIVCYDISLITNSTDFELGSYNLKFLYDCSLLDYIEGSANIDNLSAPYSFSSELEQCTNASGLGSLDFESTLGYLQFAIDYTPSTAEDITSSPFNILQNICFEIQDASILNDPEECFDLIWLNSQTRENYINSVTSIQGDNVALDVENSIYIGLDSDTNCFITDCAENNPCIPLVDADGDGVCDVGDDPDPDPNDPCVPNITDNDDDGVCDVGQNADPDPDDPCIPNITDVDNDGVCDIGEDPDPDPNDPCNPSLTAPACINPKVEFELSFSDPDVNCDTEMICYRISMNAIDQSFELGNYGLQIFYDGDLVDAIDNSPSLTSSSFLNNNYNIISVIDNQLGNQIGNGSIPFDDNLDILNININNTGASSLIIDSAPKFILYDICFDIVDPEVLENPGLCLDLIWVNNATIENYTTAITTVNISSPIGVAADLDESVYNNLPTANNCFEFDCIEGGCDVLACNDGVLISLDTCVIKLEADAVLESPELAVYSIDFYTLDDDFVRTDSLFGSDNGNTYKYRVNCEENSCWGEIKIETNILQFIDTPCACGVDEFNSTECTIFCAVEGRLPRGVISKSELSKQFMDCGPDIIGDIIVDKQIIDTLCQTGEEIIQLTYSANVYRHGSIQKEELLCQKYSKKKLPLEGHNYERFFRYPDDVQINCDISIDNMTSPDSILSLTKSLTSAFPYYLDSDTVKIEKQRIEIDRIKVSTGFSTKQEKLVAADLDEDGVQEWVLLTEAKEVFKDSIVYDTIDVEAGFPEILVKEKLCNAIVSYSDSHFTICGGSQKIIRDWTIFDWCDSNISQSDFQIIEVIDTRPPSLVRDMNGIIQEINIINDVMTYIEPWSCKGDYKLPKLNILDDCDPDVTVIWTSNFGTVQDSFIIDIPKNNVPVQVRAALIDDCNNQTDILFNVAVLDTIKPVASCLELLTVSLTTDANQLNGLAQIYAEDLSGGSNDAGCDSLLYSVLRFPPDPESIPPLGTEFVSFNCQDLGTDITIALVVQDEARNRSSCEVKVNVINKFEPDLACEDIIIDCSNNRITPPEIIGDFCNDFGAVLKLTDNSFISECRQNNMIREWFLDLDGSGNISKGDPFCNQRVSFLDENTFDPKTIKWPKHFNGTKEQGIILECRQSGEAGEIVDDNIKLGSAFECISNNDEFLKPKWCETGCGLIAASVETDTIQNSGFCFQLVNRWTVIDWCTFSSNSSDSDLDNDSFIAIEDWAQRECSDCQNGGGPVVEDSVYFRLETFDIDGFYHFNQIIVFEDNSAPVINVEREVIASPPSGSSASSTDPCLSVVSITPSATDFCNSNSSIDQLLRWKYTIEQNGEEILDGSGLGTEITVTTEEIQIRKSIEIYWEVFDGCGNVGRDTTIVTAFDDTPPSPVCIGGISTSIDMIDSSGVIWAKDFDLSSTDNCTLPQDLKYSIVNDGDIPLSPDEDGFETQASLFFPCISINETQKFDVWVWDNSLNGNKCDVEIRLSHDCVMNQTMAELSGGIETMSGALISDVNVFLKGSHLIAQQQSDSKGFYSFDNVTMHQAIELNAHKNDSSILGISTLDLLQMQRHILNLQQFNSPYKILAADMNNDEKVSVTDLLLLQKELISLDGKSSWKFLDRDAIFVDNNYPWPIDSTIIKTVTQPTMEANNFIGIKMGDVNGSIYIVESRSDQLQLNIPDQNINKGDIISLPIRIIANKNISAFQLELKTDGVEIINLYSTLPNLKSNLNPQNCRISWFDALDPMEEIEFILELKGITNHIDLSKAIQLGSKLRSEAYTNQSEILNLQIEFLKEGSPLFSIHQNYPNPFSIETKIAFELPKKAEATIQIRDVSGILVYSIDGEFENGINTISISKADVNLKAGLYYYTLTSNQYSSTKSMIVLDD